MGKKRMSWNTGSLHPKSNKHLTPFRCRPADPVFRTKVREGTSKDHLPLGLGQPGSTAIADET